MATNTEISDALASAAALALTYADLESLIKRAIAAGVTTDGRLIVATGAGGASVSFSSVDAAINSLVTIRKLAKLEDSGGGCVGLCEFLP